MRKILFCLFLCNVAFAYPPLPKPQSEEEALFVRRVIHFWRDQEYEKVNSEIQKHLKNEPNSPYKDFFLAMQGDILVHQKKYSDALSLYNQITSENILSEVRPKRFKALYLLERYQEIYREAKNCVSTLSIEEKFYFAESCFKEGAFLFSLEEGKEKALALFQEALPLYQGFQDTLAYKNFSKLAIAEIYRFTGNIEDAAPLYLELADEKKESDVLFHVAKVLQNINLAKSEEIFKELARDGHEKAAIHWLQVLAKDKKWGEIKKNRELFLSYENKETLSLSYFYLGLAAFEESHYLQTVFDLTKSLSNQIPKPFEKIALLTLMKAAKEIGRIEAGEKCLAIVKKKYPESIPEALFLQALCYERGEERKKAIFTIDELLSHFPDHPLAEKGHFEKISLLAKNKEWQNARKCLLTFFESYPDSALRNQIAIFAVELTLSRLGYEECYQDLVADLERAFSWKLFEEDAEKKLLLAKAYLMLDQTEKALTLLLAQDKPDPELLTQCYVKKGNEPEKVIFFGEKALLDQKNPSLHLHLFNAYLNLYSKNKDPSFKDKGALHLEASLDHFPVSLENRVWLARYLTKENPQRAISLFEEILQNDFQVLQFYEESLILADLYKKEREREKEQVLLEKMILLHGGEEPRAEILLADHYYESVQNEKAQRLYQKLEGSSYPYVSARAKLQNARFCLRTNPEDALKRLQELSIRKVLSTEPIHFEAAIEYAEVTANLSTPNKDEVLLENFLKVKEDFISQDNIWTKDYHASREKLPEKDRIYQAYMRYLDARIYLLQSKFTPDPSQKNTKENAAKALLSTLVQGKYAVTDYLAEKAREKLNER